MPTSRRLSEADEAVSEVVGQILVFGILSIVLVMSMFSFNIAKEQAEDRVVLATADAIASRVANLVVSTTTLAEGFADQQITLQTNMPLPQQIEGRSYNMDMGAGAVVNVPRHGYVASSSFFSADSGTNVRICEATGLPGGSISVFIIPHADIASRCNNENPPAPAASFYVVVESFQD